MHSKPTTFLCSSSASERNMPARKSIEIHRLADQIKVLRSTFPQSRLCTSSASHDITVRVSDALHLISGSLSQGTLTVQQPSGSSVLHVKEALQSLRITKDMPFLLANCFKECAAW